MSINKSNNLPSQCPSCGSVLTIDKLVCASCSTVVQGAFSLSVLAQLSTEEQQLAVNFIKTGGSLKELAKMYAISYPTIRNRIDELSARLCYLEKPDIHSQPQGELNE